MKPFEMSYSALSHLLPPLYRIVRSELRAALPEMPGERLTILDAGGRKSHYTSGIPARVIVSDMPRTVGLRSALNLGLTRKLVQQTKSRRSNIELVTYDDMTQSSFRDGAFDVVLAVEVLEHVERDREFVAEIARVLKPGGLFLMTTPNGDFKAEPVGDHKRHYRRQQLRSLLEDHLVTVDVRYAIPGGLFRNLGLRGWSFSQPVQTALSMAGNAVNRIQAALPGVEDRAIGTHHLVALGWKGRKGPIRTDQ